jgi:hypothetical protein
VAPCACRYEAALQAVLAARGLPDTPQTRAEQGELEASVGPYHAFASVLGDSHPAVEAFAAVAGALQAKHRGKEGKYPVDSGSGLPLSRPYAAPAASDPERAARVASQVGAGYIPSAHTGHAQPAAHGSLRSAHASVHPVGAPSSSPAPSAPADSGAGHGPDAYLEALRAEVRCCVGHACACDGGCVRCADACGGCTGCTVVAC